MNEFNLSEKFVRDYWNKEAIRDVKEFIKLLKEELCGIHRKDYCVGVKIIKDEIDKLAGNSLSDNQQLNEGERANGNKNKRKRSWRNGF